MHVWGVARSENPGGLIVLGGENVPPHKMSVGMLICQKLGGIETPNPPAPRLRQPCHIWFTEQSLLP